jgi:acetyl esterase/lipase
MPCTDRRDGDKRSGVPVLDVRRQNWKETLLSGFVQRYQALDVAGVPVKLDFYEGMIHNFQDRIPDVSEAIVARQKIRAFLYQQLGIGDQS